MRTRSSIGGVFDVRRPVPTSTSSSCHTGVSTSTTCTVFERGLPIPFSHRPVGCRGSSLRNGLIGGFIVVSRGPFRISRAFSRGRRRWRGLCAISGQMSPYFAIVANAPLSYTYRMQFPTICHQHHRWQPFCILIMCQQCQDMVQYTHLQNTTRWESPGSACLQ